MPYIATKKKLKVDNGSDSESVQAKSLKVVGFEKCESIYINVRIK